MNLVKYGPIIITIYHDFRQNLSNNENWDITFKGISLRTWKTPVIIINEECLNSKIPLRCKALNNQSSSPFVDSCSVCIEDIDLNKMHRELKCEHVFHPYCIDEWLLKGNNICPNCRNSAY